MSSRLQSIPVLKAGLTERELLSVVTAFLATKAGAGALGWGKFVQLAGYSSVQSARICFRPVQKKLQAFVDNNSGQDGNEAGKDVSSPPKTPKTPKAPKAPKTPKTPGSKSGRPKKRKLEQVDSSDNDLPES